MRARKLRRESHNKRRLLFPLFCRNAAFICLGGTKAVCRLRARNCHFKGNSLVHGARTAHRADAHNAPFTPKNASRANCAAFSFKTLYFCAGSRYNKAPFMPAGRDQTSVAPRAVSFRVTKEGICSYVLVVIKSSYFIQNTVAFLSNMRSQGTVMCYHFCAK